MVGQQGNNMKPTYARVGEDSKVDIQLSSTEQSKSRLKGRWVLLVACLVVLCICALSLGLYFGLNNRNILVQSHVYFEEGIGDIIPADVTFTQQEEYFSFDDAVTVYDFNTGLKVYKSKLPEEEDNACLVESFDMNVRGRPSDDKVYIKEGQVVGTTEYERFRITNFWLNEVALGPMAQDMCAGAEIRYIERLGSGDDEDVSDNGEVLLPNNRVRRSIIINRTGVTLAP